MKYRLIVVLLSLLGTNSYAGTDLWLDVHLASKHFVDGYEQDGTYTKFNENNTGLGVSIGVSQGIDVGIGMFENSYFKHAYYLAADMYTPIDRYTRIGVSVGAVTGYDQAFMVLPNVSFVSKRYKLRIGVLPVASGFFTLSVGYKF